MAYITIYKNGTFQNYSQCSNLISRTLFSYFQYFKDIEPKDFFDFVDEIVITSIYRTGSVSHSQNKAVDFCVLPLWLNPVVFCVLHEYFNCNLYLSLHNRHIHIDHYYRNVENIFWKNQKRLEVYDNNNTLRFLSPVNYYFRNRPSGNYSNAKNKTLQTQYEFTQFDKFDVYPLLPIHEPDRTRYKITKLLNYAYRNMGVIIPESDKKTLENPSRLRIYATETVATLRTIGNDIVNLTRKTGKIALAIFISIITLSAGYFLIKK